MPRIPRDPKAFRAARGNRAFWSTSAAFGSTTFCTMRSRSAR
nr:hypothetical protein [Lentzea guizhouensis]